MIGAYSRAKIVLSYLGCKIVEETAFLPSPLRVCSKTNNFLLDPTSESFYYLPTVSKWGPIY
jgi:hypothetical protein